MEKSTDSITPPFSGELRGRATARPNELRNIAKCVGCILARTAESGEEALISTPAIAACNGLPRVGPEVNSVYLEVRRLEKGGLLQAVSPDEAPNPVMRGGWQPRRTFFFRVTELGRQAMPAQPREDCGLQDPFVRITPVEQRVLDCARCILARTADNYDDAPKGFLTEQIARCLDLIPQSVGRVLRSMHGAGLLERQAVAWHTTDARAKPFRYWPSDKGAPWMRPLKAEGCPDTDLSLEPREFTASQKRILKCLACVFGGCDSDVFRRADILDCTKIDTHAIGGLLTDLVREKYLERRRSGEFQITGIGGAFLAELEQPDDCPGGRRQQWLEMQDYAFLKRGKAFAGILRCIGCLTARQEPVTSSAIAACNGKTPSGLGLQTINQPLKWLETNGFLEAYMPDKLPEVPPWGDWRQYQANFMRLTKTGLRALSIRTQVDCALQNPLVRLTPFQQKIVDCFRCVLARTADTDAPTAGGVIAQQIADCTGMRQATPALLLKKLHDEGLLERKMIQRIVAGSGMGSNLYWPAAQGRPWLGPQEAENCPGTILEAQSALSDFGPRQRQILNCMACIAGDSDKPEMEPVRLADIKRCSGLSRGTVEITFGKLLGKQYIEKRIKPGRIKTDHYVLTEAGLQAIRELQPPSCRRA